MKPETYRKLVRRCRTCAYLNKAKFKEGWICDVKNKVMFHVDVSLFAGLLCPCYIPSSMLRGETYGTNRL